MAPVGAPDPFGIEQHFVGQRRLQEAALHLGFDAGMAADAARFERLQLDHLAQLAAERFGGRLGFAFGQPRDGLRGARQHFVEIAELHRRQVDAFGIGAAPCIARRQGIGRTG